VAHGDRYAYFLIYASQYGRLSDGRQGNATAFTDWRASVGGINGVPVAHTQASIALPARGSGRSETRALSARAGGPTISIAAWWGTTGEVEALAIFTLDVIGFSPARRMLARIVRRAITVEDGLATASASATPTPGD